MTETSEQFGGGANKRSLLSAMSRGARKKCPRCGKGRLFRSYIKTADTCANCGLELSGHQADDAPPYMTVMIVGHIAIPLALAMKQIFDPALWVQFAFWTPVMIIATAWLLPVSKGALVGLQWANAMHGFASADSGPQLAA